MDERLRVAVIGGGCASMAAVWELSKPEHDGRYEITVYQEGWRLGGKGASGRGKVGAHRGTRPPHLAGLLRQRLPHDARMHGRTGGLARGVAVRRLARGMDSRRPTSACSPPPRRVAGSGGARTSRPARDLPGDPMSRDEILSLPLYLSRAFDLLRTVLTDTTVARQDGVIQPSRPIPLAALVNLGVFAGAATLAEALGLVGARCCARRRRIWADPWLDAALKLCAECRRWIEDRLLADDRAPLHLGSVRPHPGDDRRRAAAQLARRPAGTGRARGLRVPRLADGQRRLGPLRSIALHPRALRPLYGLCGRRRKLPQPVGRPGHPRAPCAPSSAIAAH